jgi:hypothetical protein
MRRLVPLLMLVVGGALVAQTITVKVKETRVRSSPRFYARSLLRVDRGDRLEKLEELGGWYKVQATGDVIGWVHSTAIETKKLQLDSGEWVETDASPEEITLAGKGFNEQVEEEYRKSHSELDYTWVDKMEKMEISDAEMSDFLKEGRLDEHGGGR